MKQLLSYTVDLSKTEGEGEFLCPCCKALISSDDETEESYSILEPKVKNNTLVGLLIRCNICSIKILLTGFFVNCLDE